VRRRAAIAALGAAGWTAFAPPDASAQTKVLRFVVPYPPGGPLDIVARALAERVKDSLGVVVVDNRAGAGGNIGADVVAKSPADGSTIVMGAVATHAINPWLYVKLPYDPIRDFTPITGVARVPNVLVMSPAVASRLGIASVADLVAYAKQNPGKLNYGSAGIGTASHIPAELMKSMAGVDIVGVQYKGVAEVMTDVMTGRMDMFFVGTQIAAQQAHAGRVRVLALTGAKRWKGLADVPTMQEAGFKGYNLINWFGLWLPAGAAPDVMARIHAEVVKALADPHVKEQFDAQGLEGVGMPPAGFARFVESESKFMNELARKIKR
jgi:tripartite-type tricarboxylate transporter receptor subunit TctC